MARRTQIFLEDDLTGDLLEEGAGESVTFSLDGTSYEIDLSEDNAQQLRDALSRYTGAARKMSTARRRTAVSGGQRRSTGGSRGNTSAIREWAKENGHEVSERGRIPNTVTKAYDAAH